MDVYNKVIEKQINDLFNEIDNKTEEIIRNSRAMKDATERIMRLVSSKVSAEAEGYLIDVYEGLVERITADDYFKNPENLNSFYRLNLREEIYEKYQFNIENIDAYQKGIEYKELNNIYLATGAGAGTLAVGGLLKLLLASVVKIPFVVVIAGAVAAACVAFFATPNRNKKEYNKAINKFLVSLKNDILDWIVDIEVYFDERVRTLYK